MTCDDATNLISAKLDGEIPAAEQAELEAHLAGCPGCRTTADVLAVQDAALTRAFAPHRNRVEHVIAGTVQRVSREQHRPAHRIQWLNTLLSAAAGFAVALLILQPWKSQTPPIVAIPDRTQTVTLPAHVVSPGIAQLALATGRIEVLPPNRSEWEPMATGATVAPGSRIRTPERVRCEFALSDGSEIRLNEGSEIRLAALRSFDLAKGRMWSTVAAADTPFNVAVSGATVTALGTKFDVNLDGQKATVIVVEGATQVTGKGRDTIVYPGEEVEIIDGTPGQAQRTHNVLVATAWVHEILAMKGRNNAELQHRLNELFAELGQTKVKVLFESEIRSLGDHAVIPLTRYLQSDRSRGQRESERREMAARILEDIAEPWSIPDLIALLSHDDGGVRFHVARALQRLTNEDQGYTPEDWRAAGKDLSQGIAAWRAWYEHNKSRFPTAGPLKETRDAPPDAHMLKKAKTD
jgi:hypothetical protein